MTHTYYYELMMQELEKPYCRFENRDEFIEAFRLLLTPQQIEVWLTFPDLSFLEKDPPAEPLSVIRGRIRPELYPDLIDMVKDLEDKSFLLSTGERAGEKVYMRNYIFGLTNTYIYKKGHPLEKPCINWFHNFAIMDDMRLGLAANHPFEVTIPHEAALTGNSRHGKIPMNLKIPDTREIIPYDLASKAVEEATRCAVRPCICRQVSQAKGHKECDVPVNYCIVLNEVAGATIASGEGVEKTKEETLDILKECRDMGLVQQINNANHPYSICNCCKDCCLCLISLAKGERKISKPSRFVASATSGCIQCGICLKYCPMEAIRMTIAGALVIPRQCIGCGVCVSKCPKGVLTLLRKDPNSPKERDIPKENRPYL